LIYERVHFNLYHSFNNADLLLSSNAVHSTLKEQYALCVIDVYN